MKPPCWPLRKALPTHDLLFLPRNISQPKVLSAWINEIERGDITSLLALKDGAVVGCGTLVRDSHSWSPHVGEIRMVVSLDVRGKGVGRALSQETFALALGAGLEKLSVQMTVDQQARDRAVRKPGLQGRGAAARPCPGRRTAGNTTSSCSGTMWRRSGHRWRLMGFRGPLRLPDGPHIGQFHGQIAQYSAHHGFVISRCNIDVALHH